MIKDKLFKKSFTISLFIHLAILIPWPGFTFIKTRLIKEGQSNPLLVVYTISRDERIEVQLQNEKHTLSKINTEDRIEKKQEEKEKIVLKTEVLPTSIAPQMEEFLLDKNQIVSLSESIDTKVIPQTVINYYQAIREEIKKKAYYYKPDFRGEGTVTILFSVSCDGVLQALSIDEINSTKISVLREAALKSVKFASPFPSFPPELKNDFITFSIAIEFNLRGKR